MKTVREIVKARDVVFRAMGYTPRPLNGTDSSGTVQETRDVLEEQVRAARERLIRR